MDNLSLLTFTALFLSCVLTSLLLIPGHREAPLMRAGIVPFLAASGAASTLATVSRLLAGTHTGPGLTGFVMAAALLWLAAAAYAFLHSRLPVALLTASASLVLGYLGLHGAGPAAASTTLTTGAFPFRGYGHIALGVVGESFAIYAAAIALLYLAHQRLLKQKLLTRMHPAAPTILHLEKMLYLTLWAGFTCLTLALVTGAIVSLSSSGLSSDLLSRKIIWALCAWLWYLATLIGRRLLKFSAKRTAAMTLGGFLILSFTFFGLAFGGLVQ